MTRWLRSRSPNRARRKRGELNRKFVWRTNGLRHSFCSYRLALVKNAPQVALEAGNSPAMVFRHYHELVSEQDAREWFAVAPPKPAQNVVRLPATAA